VIRALPQPFARARRPESFRVATTAVSIAAPLLLLLIILLLARQASPALDRFGLGFVAASAWNPVHESFGALPFIVGTLASSAIALALALPVGIATAVFLAEGRPGGVRGVIGTGVELLAAIPSVVYGFWGITWLAPRLVPLYQWLEQHASWIPLFAGPASVTGRTMLTAGLVLAVMILPIISAISREVFGQAPLLHREAALALGATRWEMIRMAVLPYGRSGVIGGAMLGLGRALGETLAVALVLSVGGGVTVNLIGTSNPSTIAANIALNFPEATGIGVNALVASGLALFVITFAVNYLARAIVNRRADFSGAN
jgi:phosphate transport system permease protein